MKEKPSEKYMELACSLVIAASKVYPNEDSYTTAVMPIFNRLFTEDAVTIETMHSKEEDAREAVQSDKTIVFTCNEKRFALGVHIS